MGCNRKMERILIEKCNNKEKGRVSVVSGVYNGEMGGGG